MLACVQNTRVGPIQGLWAYVNTDRLCERRTMDVPERIVGLLSMFCQWGVTVETLVVVIRRNWKRSLFLLGICGCIRRQREKAFSAITGTFSVGRVEGEPSRVSDRRAPGNSIGLLCALYLGVAAGSTVQHWNPLFSAPT